MKILSIIPAFELQSTIPKIFSRFIAQKPLILYSIHLAKKIKETNEIFVITDDENIAHICEINNINSVNPREIFEKSIEDIKQKINSIFNYFNNKNFDYNLLLILNPKFPLIKPKTINSFLSKNYLNNELKAAISVKKTKNYKQNIWQETEKGLGLKISNFRKNKNSKNIYKEINALKIIHKCNFSINSYLEDELNLIKLDFPENLEINNHINWWIAEKFLKRKKILIRVDGYKEIGFGHIYRMLTLTNRLIDHEILFVSNEKYKSGIKLIEKSNYPIKTFNNNNELIDIIEEFNPNIILNDILDTSLNYIQKLKNKNIFIVNFEDLGEGAKEAHLVINALYERKNFLENHYWGKDYYILREEFYIVDHKKKINEINNILITFGGTDPNNYTLRILKILNNLELKNIKINIILGLGYQNNENLLKYTKKIDLNVDIRQNISNISKYMYRADLIFTSAGRTVFEIASIGTPSIILCQNKRETLHTFANQENGIINLGLGYKLSDNEIKKQVKEILNNYKLRLKLNKKMLKNNLKDGVSTVINLIFSHYEKSKLEEG